jgi:transcriptional regulator
MHLSPAFEQKSADLLHDVIRSHPLGTLVTMSEGELDANHLPFVLVSEGPRGTLRGHVARTNPVWKMADGTDALIIFRGPDGYISPAWYPSKRETGKVVPTWNYVVVHVRGKVQAREDAHWLRDHLTALVTEHESRREFPWSIADTPTGFVDSMLAAIVGLEIPIRDIVGKWKLSQNRSSADRAGVIEGLEREQPAASSLIAAMRALSPASGA